ncbi:MAG: hypothetical protein IJ733_07790 [Lachnospiraceae bacterium]|nr:hypothetical protein [Lachnospiraceae bacterium]
MIKDIKKVTAVLLAIFVTVGAIDSSKVSVDAKQYSLYAGDTAYVAGSGDDLQVGQKSLCKGYVYHIRKGEIVHITWNIDSSCGNGGFIVGMVNSKGKEYSVKIGKTSRQTKKIVIRKGGKWYFWIQPLKANCKDGSVDFRFDISIHKKAHGKAVRTENAIKETRGNANDKKAKTYRLEIRDVSDSEKKWIKKCDTSTGIYVIEKDGRYLVYANCIGKKKEYSFHISVQNQNAKAKLVIKKLKDEKGAGYALLSVPKYRQLKIVCGKYTAIK